MLRQVREFETHDKVHGNDTTLHSYLTWISPPLLRCLKRTKEGRNQLSIKESTMSISMNTKEKKLVPLALTPSSTIALMSPSGRLNDLLPHRITTASTFLSSLGYKVAVLYNKLPPNATLKQSIEIRVSEIHSAFSNPSITAIICTIGGSTCNELLPHLDYSLIAANPKIFCGYSDITLLHYAFYTHAGLRTFYGPDALTQWCESPSPMSFTIENFISAITQPRALGSLPRSQECTSESQQLLCKGDFTRMEPLQPNSGWRWVRPGKAKGIIFGGCLPSILRIIGTQYDLPSYKDVILILELPEGEERKAVPLQRAKTLTFDLANRGVFQQIAGLVLGRTYGFGEHMTKEWEEYFLQVTEGRSFPVLSRVDIGHTNPMLTIPLGGVGELDSERGIWAVLEAGVL